MGAQHVSSEGILETREELDDVDLAILSYTARRSRARSTTTVTGGLKSGTAQDDIAQVLNLPPSTVEQRVSGLIRKLETPESAAPGPEKNMQARAASAEMRRYEVDL
jgi:DNA-binding NarL/FixJ family response regulator